MKNFVLKKESRRSRARLGILKTRHGEIQTPFFMPIATKGTVKSLTSFDLQNLGAQIVLANTYHLYLRPGTKLLDKFAGLHHFMNWSGPILTDSGGFQVFSLDADLARSGVNKTGKVKVDRRVTDQGVEFRSYLDGSKHLFTPEKVVKIQHSVGSDIMMVLDECVGNPATRPVAESAVVRTTNWARQCLETKRKIGSGAQLFGIVQGSLFKDLRLRSVEELVDLNLDGYAIGGLAVGEDMSVMYKVLDYTVPALPSNKARYLMGVGYPENIVAAVKRGVDMFDCVIPTREARHGRRYFWRGLKSSLSGARFYKTININGARWANECRSINEFSNQPELRQYSLAYLHHLFKTQEPLGLRLATLNNIEFYLQLLARIRREIQTGKL